jgi:hypothetical protein
MLGNVPESKMHIIRWLLASGWVLLILSAFYDPLSLILTDPNNLLSPLHINAERCIQVQGVCLEQPSYVLAPRLFWGIIVPLGVIILVVGGHEAWRRICPLYFISQIPRRLGIGRKRQRVNAETGVVCQELAGVDSESWLGNNFGYLQLALLFIGLNIRLLFANGSGLGFGLFLVATIAAAITVGWLYKGRSWCQYFCPMAPVQVFYTGNRGLLGSDAHLSPSASITQSMCRTVDSSGKEKSACVSCQSPCLDIDAERTYWANMDNPERKLLFYGYFGLMLGFFVYFYLYAGNWDYYYSGIWSHDVSQLTSLFKPGFFIGDRSIPIPKIVAAPLTLGIFTLVSYWGCQGLENLIKTTQKHWSEERVKHTCYVFAVFGSFNVFFVFAGRPNLKLLPGWVELLFNAFLVVVSTLWLQRNLPRSKSLYQRESLTGNLRRQLQKLTVNWAEFLDGRSIDRLGSDEVYVLAKVLPGFSRQSRFQVYQGVLQEALTDGKTQSANSLEMLHDVRQQLQISPEEHYEILNNLGIENPSLLDPTVQRSREDRLRIEGYQNKLESLLMDLIASQVSIEQALQDKQSQINAMRLEYDITSAEQEQVLLALFHPDSILLSTSATLLEQLQVWSMRDTALTDLPSNPPAPIYQLLQSITANHQRLIVTQLLNMLELLEDDLVSAEIASTTRLLAHQTVKELLTTNTLHISPQIQQILLSQASTTGFDPNTTRVGGLHVTKLGEQMSHITQIADRLTPQISLETTLQDLIQELDPLTKTASLYALNQTSSQSIGQIAGNLDGVSDPLLQETIDRVLKRPIAPNMIPTLTLDLELSGHKDRRVYRKSIVRVGRASDNDLVILDEGVSRYHAVLKVDASGMMVLQDLRSQYGLRFGSTHLRDGESMIANSTKIYLSPNDDLAIEAHLSMTASTEQPITTLEKLLWLRSSPLFQSLNHQNLLAIARTSSLIIYNQGDVLCQAGETAVSLLLLIVGTAQSDRHTFAGGEVIGEVGILTQTTYSETVIAKSPKVPTLVITSDSFNQLLDREPQITRDLLVSISQRLK